MALSLKSRNSKGTRHFYLEETYRGKDGKPHTQTVAKVGTVDTPREAILWSEAHTVGHIAIESGDSLIHKLQEKAFGTIQLPCSLIPAGKARNGAKQWWCRTHQCYYGRKHDLQSGKCKNADTILHYTSRPYVLKPQDFPGGVGVWCALPPAIYIGPGNAQKKRVLGIHLHARKAENGKKNIDHTFPAIVLPHPDPLGVSIDRIHITPPAAYAWLDAYERERELDCVKCPLCHAHHLDLGHFAQNPHKKHLCGNCGKMFQPKGKGALVSNPLHLLEPTSRFISSTEELRISSRDYCKVEVWPSTPALIWTLDRDQITGIHVHAYSSRTERAIDETYGKVILDGVELTRKSLIMSLLHDYKKPKAVNMFQANPQDLEEK